jgi:asparagine synthase (glutamine-hydrolysing)
MCGIAGFTTPPALGRDQRSELGRRVRGMAAALRHRGPDALRALVLEGVALGHARLAIVDLSGGAQPMRDPATGVTLVYNGEVFNYPELRRELSGYPFRTQSDTEVLLAAFLRWGISCLHRLNGQFALALHDPRDRTLWLARDRVGILPLYYALTRDGIAFASEAKALVAGGFARAAIDPRGLKQTLQLWSPVPPRTCVEGVHALPPGAVGRWRAGRLDVSRWWELDLDPEREELPEAEAVEQVGALLDDAVRLRLRADVPVGAYLSGGLDSSLVVALAQRALGGTLSTYSVEFQDRSFDEGPFQRDVAREVATRHHAVLLTEASLSTLLPEAVRYAEQVLVRAAPAPLLGLSREVRRHGGKVVLTGEGSDEILLGYDLYAEARVRQFWARRPGSTWRPALLRRLHPYLPLAAEGDAVLRAVYGAGLDDPTAPGFSHLVRWRASARLWRFLSPAVSAELADEDPAASAIASLPPRARDWPLLARAQALEMETLLAGNLLAVQGDRMLMAGSVEGRYPYLDHRLIELAARLPDRLKLRSLAGKWVLRRFATRHLPERIVSRPKYPFRSPPARLLAGPAAAAWAREALSPEAIRAVGLFDAERVGRLVAKLARTPGPASESDAMAITAVATAQLLPGALRPTEADSDAASGILPEVA